MVVLGVLIAVGAALVFAAIGALTLWGGLDALRLELPPDFRRSNASVTERILTLVLVGAPIVITALFGLLAAGRIFQVALGPS